ncbi:MULTISPECIES: vgr related protein [Pacificimonas]|nr:MULTISPECIES: vgr related protein [Pacificimonas]
MRFRLGKYWFLHPARAVMAPDGNIWFHPNGGLWRRDYSGEALWLRGLIVHELTHVWQHQRGVFLPLKRHPFCRYRYDFEPGRPFAAYGIEQQAELVRHAYLLSEGRRLAEKPDLAAYRAVLPFPAGHA